MAEHRLLLALTILIACHSLPRNAAAGEPAGAEAQKLALQVHAIFERSCFACHGKAGSQEGGFGYILDYKELVGRAVLAGNPERSRLFKRMGIVKDMPPSPDDDPNAKGIPRPSDDEIAIVKRWIAAGAPAPVLETVKARPPVTLRNELKAMRDYLRDLKKTPREQRGNIRFFTLGHLHNSQVSDGELRLYRAALSKLLNSLSWEPDIVLPEAVDAAGTVLAVNVSALSWDRGALWNEILKLYPYGLKHQRYPDDAEISELADEIYQLSGSDVPALRADWFIATASRPPLYHALLQIPDSALHLEKKLGVDVYANLLSPTVLPSQVARSGFTSSGVSGHNRLVERHRANFGAYWKSYDFKSSAGLGNLFVFPLGPEFPGNPFQAHAFKHDGGEIIFNLPNGLQGYMLVDGKDKRIDAGPIEVVSDSKKISGTPAIVNGLSCIACHQHGTLDLKDSIRTSSILGGQARDRVRQLYPPVDDMNRLLGQDKLRFLAALEKAASPFLKVGDDARKDIQDFPESVSFIARWYISQELNLEDAAHELGAAPEKLRAAIDNNQLLRERGLVPLANGGTIKREVWENLDFTISACQEAARVLKLGTPVTPQ